MQTWGSITVCRAILGITINSIFAAATIAADHHSAQAQTSNAIIHYDIPTGSLIDALSHFARQSGVAISIKADQIKDLQTSGLTGSYSIETGFATLLAGSGYQIRKTDAGYVLRRAPVATGQTLPMMTVTANRESSDDLMPEYPGGQVATGGQVGILGNRDIMDTPFTQINYTSKLIQDQQARFIGDVLRNDPSVQFIQSMASGFTQFAIRGFQVGQGDTLFNGLAIAPTVNGTMMTESIEQVEVLRGPNALLNGATPEGSIGGMVNLVPKRAGDEALTQLTAQYMSDTQVGGHVDIGRRFGSHKQFGIRINGVYRTGDLPIDHSSRESALATIGLDYRGDIVRLSADFGYQEQDLHGSRRQFTVASGVTALPEPPHTRTNANQPWELNHTRALFGTLRGEIDVTRHITAFADFGITHDRRQSILLSRQITNSQGTLAPGSISLLAFDIHTVTFNTGLRGAFDTGPIHHRAVAAYTLYSRENPRSLVTSPLPASNIYNPVFAPAPSSSLLPGYGDVRPFNETDLSSVMIGDTLSVLDDRVQLTGGIRFQQIKTTTFDLTTGAPTNQYDKNAPTPMVGLIVKPWQHVSLYGNYIEGLQQGPTAPATAANAGEVFAPFISKGYEAGVKVDFGHVVTTLAAFQMTQPSAFINPATNVFGVNGEHRHRGLELSVFGEVIEGLRLLGGMSYINAELTRTQGGVNQGNKVTILPFQFTLYGEWDVPFLKGFTITSRVAHATSQYQDQANTRKIPEWTQWDLGAQYRFKRMNSKLITIRANIENVLNSNAWYGTQLGQLIVRDPRTFLLSATFDFDL